MKKLVSLCLILSVLLGVMIFPVQGSTTYENGASIYDPVTIQDLTGPKFSGITVDMMDGDRIYYIDGYHTGIMNVYGEEILPPVYTGFSYLGGGYYVGGNGTAGALFYEERQLTEFKYTDFTKMAVCFRVKQGGENYVFLDNNGKEISVPKVCSSPWKVIDIVPGKAILIFKDRVYIGYGDYGPVYIPEEYQLLDWKGKAITNATGYTIKIADGESYTVGSSRNYEHNYFDGTPVVGKRPPEGYSWHSEYEYGGLEYHILTKNDYGVNDHYLFDADYNMICKLDVMYNAGSPVAPISATLFVVRKPRGESVLMNSKGEVLADLPGYFTTYVGLSKSPATEEEDLPIDRFLLSDGENTYLYDYTGKQLAVMEGATLAENEECYITAELADNKKAIYDLDGNLLFTYDADAGITCSNGIIFRKRSDRYAVVGMDGELLTDYIFNIFYNATGYGLMKVKIAGQKGFYLINNQGQVLNTQGYDEFSRRSNSYYTYSIGGKMGILRIVNAGDDLFVDVPYGTWYYESVEDCAEMGLFNGTSPAKFSPDKPMTRAMLVTVLWRLDGEKAPAAPAEFADVAPGSWYANAVAWASENGIVNGVGKGKFNPDGNVTREQMATILRRYAESKGLDVSGQADLTPYPDMDQVSDYATEAMAWANAVGLINGNKVGGTIYLQPKGNATRAQVAAILMRYVEKLMAN